MRIAGCLGLLIALLGLAPAAVAAPALGRWEGTRADGRGLTFTVVRQGSGTTVEDVTLHCPDRFAGRLGATASRELGPRTPLEGRLGRTFGTVRVRAAWRQYPDGDGCRFDPPVGFRVSHVAAAPVATGTWRVTGPVLPEKQIIDGPRPVNTDVTFRVGGGGAVIADARGVLYGQSSAGWAECGLAGDGLFAGRIRPDGSFTLVEHQTIRGQTRVIEGRFTSPTTVQASYTTSQCAVATPLSGAPVAADGGPGPTGPAVDYVALGDSYSAGEGVPPFEPGTGERGGCHRSPRAYPQIAQPLGIALRRRFVACSAAVTANVGRLGPDGLITGTTQRPSEGTIQLDRLTEAEWASVGLVTVTIGGNDAEFATSLEECIRHACAAGARARRIMGRVRLTTALLLEPTYAAIARRAPQATVVVLGYPRLFPGAGQAARGCLANPLPIGRQLFLNRVGDRLRDVIARETRQAGFHFLDVMPAFAGHEPCGPKDDWVFGLKLGRDKGFVSAKSYHPNAAGQAGYARALERFLSCVVASGAPLRADGLPVNPGPGRAAPPRCTPG